MRTKNTLSDLLHNHNLVAAELYLADTSTEEFLEDLKEFKKQLVDTDMIEDIISYLRGYSG